MEELKAVIETLQKTVYANPKAKVFLSCKPRPGHGIKHQKRLKHQRRDS